MALSFTVEFELTYRAYTDDQDPVLGYTFEHPGSLLGLARCLDDCQRNPSRLYDTLYQDFVERTDNSVRVTDGPRLEVVFDLLRADVTYTILDIACSRLPPSNRFRRCKSVIAFTIKCWSAIPLALEWFVEMSASDEEQYFNTFSAEAAIKDPHILARFLRCAPEWPIDIPSTAVMADCHVIDRPTGRATPIEHCTPQFAVPRIVFDVDSDMQFRHTLLQSMAKCGTPVLWISPAATLRDRGWYRAIENVFSEVHTTLGPVTQKSGECHVLTTDVFLRLLEFDGFTDGSLQETTLVIDLVGVDPTTICFETLSEQVQPALIVAFEQEAFHTTLPGRWRIPASELIVNRSCCWENWHLEIDDVETLAIPDSLEDMETPPSCTELLALCFGPENERIQALLSCIQRSTAGSGLAVVLNTQQLAEVEQRMNKSDTHTAFSVRTVQQVEADEGVLPVYDAIVVLDIPTMACLSEAHLTFAAAEITVAAFIPIRERPTALTPRILSRDARRLHRILKPLLEDILDPGKETDAPMAWPWRMSVDHPRAWPSLAG